ncbi:hypothetical protein B0H15DRAFT_929995 [Mycena belliarum]|uniref:F-box domain-containing protein n=1 Tax=Mycena belliarum TaxID=1033014 RepID=A0AAD6UBF0_9AGAR|nr:hypothetical protein B0H15DRAFT_929995 [Mycena belliae]
MACSICLLPFIPDLSRATHPLPEHTPSESVVPKDTAMYFQACSGASRRLLGCVQKFHYYSSNMFGSFTGMEVVTWESGGGTFFMAHHVCFALFRHALKVEDDDIESKITLCAYEIILSRPQGGANAGRLRDIAYERVGEEIDLRRFWTPSGDEGCNVFDWGKLKTYNNGALSWLIQRPDIFPRFSPVLSPERLALLGPPPPESERKDMITTMPLELILHLLPYLPPKAYVCLMSTCRFLRYQAFTTFQSHARTQVLQLPWAVPTPCELRSIKPKFRAEMAGADEALRGGDWYLYLNQVHWTKSMRVRRWIWAQGEEIARVWVAKLPRSAYADVADGVKSKTRIQFEKEIKNKVKEQDFMRMINEQSRRSRAELVKILKLE